MSADRKFGIVCAAVAIVVLLLMVVAPECVTRAGQPKTVVEWGEALGLYEWTWDCREAPDAPLMGHVDVPNKIVRLRRCPGNTEEAFHEVLEVAVVAYSSGSPGERRTCRDMLITHMWRLVGAP